MVHEKVRPLLALGLAGLEVAKKRFLRRLVYHGGTLVLLLIGAVVPYFDYLLRFLDHFVHDSKTWIEVGSAVASCVTEVLAFLAHYEAMELHSLSRQVMRRVMLMDALHPEEAPANRDHMQGEFPPAALHKAEALLRENDKTSYLTNYYYSARPTDPKRLRDHLLESATFSQQLYREAFRTSLKILVALIAVAVLVLVPWWYFRAPEAHAYELAVKIAVTVLAFLPACQELDHMLLYRSMSQRLLELVQRLERLYTSRLDPEELKMRLMADFGDYGACTTFAPPIRTWVYRHHALRLAEEFEQKMKALSQAETPAPGG